MDDQKVKSIAGKELSLSFELYSSMARALGL